MFFFFFFILSSCLANVALASSHHHHHEDCDNPYRYAISCSKAFTEMPAACFLKGEDEGTMFEAVQFCTRFDDNGSRPIAVEDIQQFFYGNSLICRRLGHGPYLVNAYVNDDGIWRRYSDHDTPVDFASFRGHIDNDCDKGEGLLWYPDESGSDKHPHMGSLKCVDLKKKHKPLCIAPFHLNSFDLDKDNGLFWALQVTIVAGNVFQGAVTLYIRERVLLSIAAFDALTPYYDHVRPVLMSDHHEKEHESERTRRNKNIAILYAFVAIARSVVPEWMQEGGALRRALQKLGLNADATLEHPGSRAAHWGLKAGEKVMAFAINDALNQNGFLGGKVYNRVPWSDYSGFVNQNTAYNITHPTKWQPLILPVEGTRGQFAIQTLVTPPLSLQTPITYPASDVSKYIFPPYGRMDFNSPNYKRYVDEAIDASAKLTDHDKLISELYIEKMGILQPSLDIVLKDVNLIKAAAVFMGTNIAIHDIAIPVWIGKRQYNAIRPQNAVPYFYGSTPIRAWGGPGKGTVEMRASDYSTYLPTPDHPEYPSASTAICAAQAQLVRNLLGSDKLDWTITWYPGSSFIEPGHVPKKTVKYHIKTWTQFEKDCGWSRVLCGAHFSDSVDVAFDPAHTVADGVSDFIRQHIVFDD